MQEYRVEIDWFGTERWYNKDGQLYRDDDEPAVVCTDGSKYWCLNGKRHRENDKPALIFADGTQCWCINGQLHRESGPAVIYSDGREEFWVNGKQQPNPKESTATDIEIVKSEEQFT
jgi:hypothetical protein